MNYKQALRMMWIIAVVMIITTLVLFICHLEKAAFFFVIFFAPLPIMVNLLFYRCPSCRCHLGRGMGEYCRHCGAWLEEDLEYEKQQKEKHREQRKADRNK